MKCSLLIMLLFFICGSTSQAFRDLETGTFLTRDPIGYADGPNVYCYVHCNPIICFDPLGLELRYYGTPQMIDEADAIYQDMLDKAPPALRGKFENINVTLFLEENGKEVFGSFYYGKIDLADFRALPDSGPICQSSVFAHELMEQYLRQELGVDDFNFCHGFGGVPTEEKMTGYKRGPMTCVKNRDGSVSYSMTYSRTTSDGNEEVVSVSFDHSRKGEVTNMVISDPVVATPDSTGSVDVVSEVEQSDVHSSDVNETQSSDVEM